MKTFLNEFVERLPRIIRVYHNAQFKNDESKQITEKQLDDLLCSTLHQQCELVDAWIKAIELDFPRNNKTPHLRYFLANYRKLSNFLGLAQPNDVQLATCHQTLLGLATICFKLTDPRCNTQSHSITFASTTYELPALFKNGYLESKDALSELGQKVNPQLVQPLIAPYPHLDPEKAITQCVDQMMNAYMLGKKNELQAEEISSLEAQLAKTTKALKRAQQSQLAPNLACLAGRYGLLTGQVDDNAEPVEASHHSASASK